MDVGYRKPTTFVRLRDKLLRFGLFSLAYRQFTANVNFPIHFIVGHYSSGTTILDRLISMHPNCARLHTEGVQLVHFLDTPEDHGSRRNWLRVSGELKRSLTEAEVKVCGSLWSKLSNYNEDTLCMVEKSIVNITRIESFCKFLPSSKVIHVVRDINRIKSSYERRGLLKTIDDQHDLLEQIETTQKYVNRLDPDRVHHVSYEDLIGNPIQELSQIYSFLGLYVPEIKFDGKTLVISDKRQVLE